MIQENIKVMQKDAKCIKPLHPEIKAALEKHGQKWIIAAQVHGSIGYFDPRDAERNLKHYLEGEREDFCERCYSLYAGKLEDMLLWDIQMFRYFQEECPDSYKATMVFIHKWMNLPEEPFGNSIGLMYPVIAP
ncbi:MAG: hypothetical protein ABSF21_00170 [Dehalococcoidia bacterium]|jgi:hypothetical protein